jgi:hypothetical protein
MEVLLLTRRIAVVAFLLALSSPLAMACSCINHTPIQPAFYSGRAVFTARVIQLMGRAWTWPGLRASTRVLAVVHHQYWGLPWYWPKIVVLDGGKLCDIAMIEGEEYLVSGRLGRYGVLDVGHCSRTLPIKAAQIDLRTVDPATCSAPGGTFIGDVSEPTGTESKRSPARNIPLTFRDLNGKAYTTQTDKDGVYELRHVPPGSYTLDSRFSADRYLYGGADVRTGICTVSSVGLNPYSITGRVIPHIDDDAEVSLLGTTGDSPVVSKAVIASDGRFYFGAVNPDEYYLAVRLGQGSGTVIYYPGTSNRNNAVKIRFAGQPIEKSFDFDPKALPLIPLPVLVESPEKSHPIPIDIRTQSPNWSILAERRGVSGTPMTLLVLPGQSYRITAYGYGKERWGRADRKSEAVAVTATPGMKAIHISLAAPER